MGNVPIDEKNISSSARADSVTTIIGASSAVTINLKQFQQIFQILLSKDNE